MHHLSRCSSMGRLTGPSSTVTLSLGLSSGPKPCWMEPPQQFDHSIVAAGFDPNSTSFTESYCTSGVSVADVAVAQTTTDDCSINPGPPHLCDAGLMIKVPGTTLITVLIVAMLMLQH